MCISSTSKVLAFTLNARATAPPSQEWHDAAQENLFIRNHPVRSGNHPYHVHPSTSTQPDAGSGEQGAAGDSAEAGGLSGRWMTSVRARPLHLERNCKLQSVASVTVLGWLEMWEKRLLPMSKTTICWNLTM